MSRKWSYRISRETIVTDGYCILDDVQHCEILNIATSLGTPTVDPRHPDVIRSLSPQDIARANPNTLSSRYGLDQFPFHSDTAHWRCPAKYILLYCGRSGAGRRQTFIIDSRQWILTTEELHLLTTSVWRSRYVRPFLCSPLEMVGAMWSVRYDLGCMTPYSPQSFKARTVLNKHIEASPNVRIDWYEGMLLILDNHRILHARGPSPVDDRDRIIERVLVGGSYENMGF